MNRRNDSRPRIAVFAYSEVGSACLEDLIRDGANVAVVYTHEDDPKDEIWFRSVKQTALDSSIEVRAPSKIDADEINRLRDRTDLIFSFYYRAMIPKEVLISETWRIQYPRCAPCPNTGRACINWQSSTVKRD